MTNSKNRYARCDIDLAYGGVYLLSGLRSLDHLSILVALAKSVPASERQKYTERFSIALSKQANVYRADVRKAFKDARFSQRYGMIHWSQLAEESAKLAFAVKDYMWTNPADHKFESTANGILKIITAQRQLFLEMFNKGSLDRFRDIAKQLTRTRFDGGGLLDEIQVRDWLPTLRALFLLRTLAEATHCYCDSRWACNVSFSMMLKYFCGFRRKYQCWIDIDDRDSINLLCDIEELLEAGKYSWQRSRIVSVKLIGRLRQIVHFTQSLFDLVTERLIRTSCLIVPGT